MLYCKASFTRPLYCPPMTTTATTHSRNRTLYALSWLVGTAGYLGLLLVGQVLAGVAVLGLGGVTAVALHRSAGERMLDERDAAVVERASARTMQLVGLGAGVAFPTLVAMDALGRVAFPAWLEPVGLFVALLFGVWGVMLLLARAGR